MRSSVGQGVAIQAGDATGQIAADTKVLVVEDNATNQLVLGEMLAGLGVRVVYAEDGRDALVQVMGEQPDLTLMDLHMPVMDGYQATAMIREWEARHRQGQRMPIIALTADALPGVRARCLAMGMDGFLLKPILHADLVDLLVNWLGWCAQGAPARLEASREAASVAPAKDACLDREIIQNWRENVSAEAFARIVDGFLDGTRDQLAQISQHLAQELAVDVAESLHKLKSSSATFGSSNLPPLCTALEQAARLGGLAGVRNGLPELAAEFECLMHALEPLRATVE